MKTKQSYVDHRYSKGRASFGKLYPFLVGKRHINWIYTCVSQWAQNPFCWNVMDWFIWKFITWSSQSNLSTITKWSLWWKKVESFWSGLVNTLQWESTFFSADSNDVLDLVDQRPIKFRLCQIVIKFIRKCFRNQKYLL